LIVPQVGYSPQRSAAVKMASHPAQKHSASQFLANLHLNRLDPTLSALPGVRAYLRDVHLL